MATVARTRTDQRFPVDLERFWNVRTGRASCSSLAPLLRKGGGLVDAPRQRASRGEGRIPLSPHLSSRRLTSGFVYWASAFTPCTSKSRALSRLNGGQ